MEGSVIIEFGDGWACSNESTETIERTVGTDDKGNRYSKHTKTIRGMYYFNTVGDLAQHKGEIVKAVFMSDDSGEKQAYLAMVKGITPEMVVLEVISDKINKNEILKKIKGGYNYGNN